MGGDTDASAHLVICSHTVAETTGLKNGVLSQQTDVVCERVDLQVAASVLRLTEEETVGC